MSIDAGYTPLFDPAAPGRYEAERILRRGDEAPAGGYVYDRDGRIALAVNVALATGRPLLVRGKPGSGKSSLAADVASRLGWRYYQETITSRTRARDLLWSFDAIRRLNDANIDELKDPLAYVTPGVLWWAFSAGTAATRGMSSRVLGERGLQPLGDPSPRPGVGWSFCWTRSTRLIPTCPMTCCSPSGRSGSKWPMSMTARWSLRAKPRC